MTKDLVACIHGLANVKEGMYLNTEDFLQAIAEQLERSQKAWARIFRDDRQPFSILYS